MSRQVILKFLFLMKFSLLSSLTSISALYLGLILSLMLPSNLYAQNKFDLCVTDRSKFSDAYAEGGCTKTIEVDEAGEMEINSFQSIAFLNGSGFEERSARDFLLRNKGIKFSLIVDGVCSGICSRLLLPISSDVSFEKDAFAVLTDSSMKNYVMFLGTNLISKPRSQETESNKHSGSNIDEMYKSSYTRFKQEADLLTGNLKDVAHLLLHDVELTRQNLNLMKICKPARRFGIIVTEEYMQINRIKYNPSWVMPSLDEITSSYVEKYEEGTLQLAYDYKTFFNYPHGLNYKNCYVSNN